MFSIISLLLKQLRLFPGFLMYIIYDWCIYIWFNLYRLFYGWGIHLYTGKFGQGKTSLMTIKAYRLCKKFPQLHVVTNIRLKNFPAHTKILPLRTAKDILNAPKNTLVLIDEIGTLFNSRDFSSGKESVPKPVFQHLCQCRKRHMMILATVQRFNLLDKQIRDITATVTTCNSYFKHPFSRMITGRVYDIDEYEAYTTNKMYVPRILRTEAAVQTDFYRSIYDTTQLIQGLIKSDYISDEEILRNQGADSVFGDGSKESRKAYKKSVKRRV